MSHQSHGRREGEAKEEVLERGSNGYPSPIAHLKTVIKRIDFGEDVSASNSDVSMVDIYPTARPMSPVAASDPDLTRARSLREVRLRSLFKDEAGSNTSIIKQETVL